MRRILGHPTSEGGNARIVGKLAGQDFNSRELVGMLDGSPEEQMRAVAMLRNNPFALVYIGALHKSEGIRSIAISYLEDPYQLLKIANSSPHYDAVVSAFEKIGGNVEELQGEICLMVASHSPFGDDRIKALKRVRQIVGEGKVLMIGMHYADIGYNESDADVHTLVTNQDEIDKLVLSGGPYDEAGVSKRKYAYSSEYLAHILEGG